MGQLHTQQASTWESHKPLLNLASPAVKRAVDTGNIRPASTESSRHPLDLIGRLSDLPLKELEALDLGCGLYDSPISCQVPALPFKKLISVDAHLPVITQAEYLRVDAREFTPIHSEIKEYVLGMPLKSVDVVLFLDSLEHLTRCDAILILRLLDYVVKSRILIWLPLGECPQDEYGGNPHQLHSSTWYEKDLKRLGYNVQVFPQFHKHFNPNVDAAWAVKNFS